MSKKSKKRSGKAAEANAARPEPARRARPLRYAAAALSACALLAASFAATRFEPVRRVMGLRPLTAAPAQQSGNLPLAKEYVYAGDRLVATEETAPAATPTPTPTPTPSPSGPTPTNLVATAEFPSSGVATVRLTWSAPAPGPTVVSYVVERMSAGTEFQQITTVQEPTRTYNDTGATLDSAYLYRVRAVFNAGTSDYSNQDLATAVAFTDGSLQGVTIKATHLAELRRAVNAVRALVPNLGAASWTYPNPVSSPSEQRRRIYLEDVTDLRTRLDEALGSLGLQSAYPTAPLLARGAAVYADHFEQIRARVR